MKFVASNGVSVSSETQAISGYVRVKFETETTGETFELSGPQLKALVEALDYEKDHEPPVIPSDAAYITWCDPFSNGEERIAMRYGHHANKVWRMGLATLDEDELVRDHIGDGLVTVLVRKDDPRD